MHTKSSLLSQHLCEFLCHFCQLLLVLSDNVQSSLILQYFLKLISLANVGLLECLAFCLSFSFTYSAECKTLSLSEVMLDFASHTFLYHIDIVVKMLYNAPSAFECVLV